MQNYEDSQKRQLLNKQWQAIRERANKAKEELLEDRKETTDFKQNAALDPVLIDLSNNNLEKLNAHRQTFQKEVREAEARNTNRATLGYRIGNFFRSLFGRGENIKKETEKDKKLIAEKNKTIGLLTTYIKDKAEETKLYVEKQKLEVKALEESKQKKAIYESNAQLKVAAQQKSEPVKTSQQKIVYEATLDPRLTGNLTTRELELHRLEEALSHLHESRLPSMSKLQTELQVVKEQKEGLDKEEKIALSKIDAELKDLKNVIEEHQIELRKSQENLNNLKKELDKKTKEQGNLGRFSADRKKVTDEITALNKQIATSERSIHSIESNLKQLSGQRGSLELDRRDIPERFAELRNPISKREYYLNILITEIEFKEKLSQEELKTLQARPMDEPRSIASDEAGENIDSILESFERKRKRPLSLHERLAEATQKLERPDEDDWKNTESRSRNISWGMEVKSDEAKEREKEATPEEPSPNEPAPEDRDRKKRHN